jgi:hydroxycarboxylate dehydrogenase B
LKENTLNKSTSDSHVFQAKPLRAAMQLVVRGFGSEPAEVDAVVDNLIEANLKGHDSHGIGMLPRYSEAYAEGNLTPNQRLKTVLDTGSLLRLNGGHGFGQVMGRDAMDWGITRARQHGSCIVALGQSHHLGRIGAWAEQAAAAGLVSIHFVNVVSRAIVAPFGGSDARFGTNPFCVGVPLRGREPVILDFATSVIAQGKTRVAYNKGETLEPGCLIDDLGQPTQEPRFSVVPPLGALLTFGGHKGSGLALMCELLGGALAAGQTQRDHEGKLRRVLNGMLSVLLDPAALGGQDHFETEAQAFLSWMKASPPRDGFDDVLAAGEPERALMAQRSQHGIPVDVTTWSEILQAATRLGVDAGAVDRAARA